MRAGAPGEVSNLLTDGMLARELPSLKLAAALFGQVMLDNLGLACIQAGGATGR